MITLFEVKLQLNIVQLIKQIPNLRKTQSCSDKDISLAETKLNLKFAEDYKIYLKTFGSISFNSNELTGLNIEKYNNVIDLTLQERNLNSKFPLNFYVIHNIGNEGILVLQDNSGNIYEYYNNSYTKIYPSFSKYISSLL